MEFQTYRNAFSAFLSVDPTNRLLSIFFQFSSDADKLLPLNSAAL